MPTRMPALHLAAGADDATGVGALIAGGADVDATDPVRPRRLRPCARADDPPRSQQHERTALVQAAERNAEGVAKLLIEAGADLEAKDEVRPVGRCMRACAQVQ